MIKNAIFAVLAIVMTPGMLLARTDAIRYQNMQFSGGELSFSRDLSKYDFKNLQFLGVKCSSKGVFCINFEGVPFVAPCEVGAAKIGDISFSREKQKLMRILDKEKEIFVVDAVKRKVRIRYFWSKSGLEAFVLFVDSDFALYLPFEKELLKYPVECSALQQRGETEK
jgi:hypothetical protein